jgi:hypothetical protein
VATATSEDLLSVHERNHSCNPVNVYQVSQSARRFMGTVGGLGFWD